MRRRKTARNHGIAVLLPTVMVPIALTALSACGSTEADLSSSVPQVETVPAALESDPVTHSGDAIDDPAIWVHPSDPARSLVIGNDKKGALETYDMSGDLVQRIPDAGFWGNVDVRQQVEIAGRTHDVVAVNHDGIRLYTIDPASRQLQSIADGHDARPGAPDGFCLYDSGASLYAFTITGQGLVEQYRVVDEDSDGLLETSRVRSFNVGSEAEGCVADDDTGALYVSEEDHALWRYSADPDSGNDRTAVDLVVDDGGRLAPDIEGVTLVDQPDGGGYVIVSAQRIDNRGSSYFAVYDRSAGNGFVKAVRITGGATADDCDGTDGITAYSGFLGPQFPDGLFVCQDNSNSPPGTNGNQNFKYADLGSMVDTAAPPPDDSSVAFVAAASSNSNRLNHRVQIPSDVRAGDRLVLLLSGNVAAELTGPDGWSELESDYNAGMDAGTWTRTATAGSANGLVTATTDRWTKSDLTIAAYRGDNATTPAVTASESIITAARNNQHTTPTVPVTVAGSWLISYWGAESGSATAWAPPGGVQTRAASTGNGGGHITALLTDSAGPVGTGPGGGITAVLDATAHATRSSLVISPGT